MVCAMKWQGDLERPMDIDTASQKRKNAQGEAHQEAEKIEVRPGHTTPRAQLLTSATCRCGARAGIRDAGPVASYLDPFRIETAQLRREADGGGWPSPCCPPL